MTSTRAEVTRTRLQQASLAVGVVFLIIGILGFIPGITTQYQSMEAAGHESTAMLFGLFQVSALHNIVHLIFGFAGIAMARTWDSARLFLIGGGIIYLILWIYGLIVNQESTANFVPLNTADNWLHFVLGVVMIALGVLLSRHPNRARA
ncbi:DUF4383 domain-containing protein [Herbidospora galbida]|uniref:DUF4383 domain-containing protein n=1 Tax=Herbidospora galbida TaxID=2575442 RepID=A0A4U3MIZ8_9ACTN|nr:DUF4383 domain-containing protein [Herbidospora galbida]TKK88374.1 DUF4383 domain-containing protein [Herbidospora galbida]